MYNLLIFSYEKDLNYQSAFYNDLKGLVRKDNDISVHIIYHSNFYFGDYEIEVVKDRFSAKKIEWLDEDNYELVKGEVHNLVKKHYKEGAKNILVLSGHAHVYFANYEITETDIFDGLKPFELIIMDCCYASQDGLMNSAMNCSKYLIACQGTSPFFGFVGEKFVDILKSKEDKITKYKMIIDAYIKRNSNKKNKALNYRTDAVLLDLKLYKKFVDNLDPELVDLNKKNRFERGFNYHDGVSALKSPEKKKELKQVVLYRKVNNLGKIHIKKLRKRLGGITFSS